MRRHAAPFGKLLIGTSLFASLICVGVSALMWSRAGATGEARVAVLGITALPLLIVAVSALFMVRGYVVTADEILVERPLWRSHFERRKLQSAVRDPAALNGSIRLFGNGGLFSFTGLYRSGKLGRYHAFVTDPGRCVILRFSDRVVVVSPADPDAFIREVSERR